MRQESIILNCKVSQVIYRESIKKGISNMPFHRYSHPNRKSALKRKGQGSFSAKQKESTIIIYVIS